MNLFVKICGITRVDDAEAAVAHGATAIGFIFWPKSPRAIDPEQARAIVAELPDRVVAVGVFVNESAAVINQIAAHARLSAVQLHGDEEPGSVAAIEAPVVKAVHVDSAEQVAAAAAWPPRVRLLADVSDTRQRGGTGRTVDWDRAAELAAIRPIILAGGLTPENIAAAIERVRPYGVDVSSGVERVPGIKDHRRLAALFAALAIAETTVEAMNRRFQ